MQKFKMWLIRFMSGRNGVDDLAKMESWLVMILFLVSLFTRFAPLYYIAFGIMIHMYFRVFSRNVSKRYQENSKYTAFRYRMVVKWDKFKKEMRGRKTHKYFRCPQCRQKVRVPKGRGRICITCPKCREEFIKKS